MFKKGIYIILLVFTTSVFGQNYIEHTVKQGETITQIAQKYKVTPYDIYKLNPDSQNGIKPDSVILIPKSTEKPIVKTVDPKIETPKPVLSSNQVHIVKAKETLYGILKAYNITQEELEKNNPFLKTDGLQPGQELLINKNSNPPKLAPISNKTITHQVLPKETKYGIATKYSITVEELERQNPVIVANLPIGYVLKIDTLNSNNEVPKSVTPKKIITETPKPTRSTAETSGAKPESVFEYTVKSGETMYSLTKQFAISSDKLMALNPSLSDGVKEGMILKLPASLSFTKEVKSPFVDLTKSIVSQQRKELVLLLPFNISKIESDSLVSTAARLKKDKFLNMTLDFYSGALMAIDSAKTLGMNINVKIFDSQETKTSSNAVAIVQENAQNANAVIGPFYQTNVEKVAEALESKNIPVISPLSKDYDKSYTNLYQSTPKNDLLKEAMFDFMKAKNGNIIAVVDPKKPEVKQYIVDNQKETKFVGLTEKATFVGDSIKKYFVKDKINFVVMESQNYYTITTTLNTMISAMKEYQMQLVILETNEMLDYEEIALTKLTKLKLTYPSLTRENESIEGAHFEKAYRKKNRVLPNQYAIRGFDLTFDTMLRLSQDKPFEESIITTVTEQVENKFDYSKKVAGGFINNGIYILYYNTDLTIKLAQ
jgi:LysM repeat protein